MRDSRSSCEGLTEDEGGDGGTGGGGQSWRYTKTEVLSLQGAGLLSVNTQHKKTLQCTQPANNSAIMFDLLKSAMFKQNMYFNFRM